MKSKFLGLPRRTVGCLSLMTLLATPAAHAVNPAPATWPTGEAVRGKATYRNNCVGCHLGGDATLGIQNISQGAGPGGQSRINNALLTNKGGMGFLEPTLSAQDLSDINAYLTNPALSGITVSSATVSPSNLFFQPTEVGSSSTATVTFAVAGGAVTLSGLAISPSLYTLTGGTCSANMTLPSGSTCTALVTFTPTQSGSSPMGTLTFTHNAAASSSTTVSLSGSGTAAPVAVVSPSSVPFAATAVGASSAAQVVTLTNTGNTSLNLTAIAVSSPSFRISGGTCSPGSYLQASAQCTVLVSFAPSASGTASGNLTLRHNGGVAGMEMTSSVPLTALGVLNAPAVTVSSTALAFTQVVGTSSTQTVTVSNQGSAAVSLSGVSFLGPQGGEFARTGGSCASTLAAGASCTMTVAFTPAAAGTRVGTLSVSHSAAGSPATVVLTGLGTSGVSPALASNTEGLVFAPQGVNSTSSAQTVTLTNSGNATLTFTTLAVAGPQMSDFVLSGGTCSPSTPLAAGASCTVQLSARPLSMGHKVAHLVMTSDAVNGTVTIPLVSKGLAASVPVATFSPMGIDLGNATVGGAAVTRVLRLTNTGSAALSVTNIGVNGTGVTQTNNCGASVAAGASCNITVNYAPTAAAALSGGRVTLSSNTPGSPHSVALTGTGVSVASPALSWATMPDGAFADTAVGGAAAVKTFTLNNAGPGTATISAVQALGAQQGEFVLGGTCLSAGSVAAAGSCTVTVGFAPALMGSRSAMLHVSTPGASPTPVALSGRGVALLQNGLSASVSSLSFPATAVGSSAVLPLSFTNTGSTALALSSLTSGNAAFSTQLSRQPGCTGLPLMVAPGQTCALEVTYQPSNTNVLSDNLTLSTNASPVQVALHAGTDPGSGGGGAGGGSGGGSAGGSGGGGCALAGMEGDPQIDPTLWLLCLAAAGVLGRRMARRA